MSFRVVGYSPDGTRRIVDDGPAYARPQGHGGEALGSRYVLTSVTHAEQQRRTVLPRQPQAEARKERCGVWLPVVGEPCYRLPGHRDHHRSRAAMQDDSERRRTHMPTGVHR